MRRVGRDSIKGDMVNTFKKVVLAKTEDILTQFFTAWQNEDWAGMSEACQQSWSNFIKVHAVDRLMT